MVDYDRLPNHLLNGQPSKNPAIQKRLANALNIKNDELDTLRTEKVVRPSKVMGTSKRLAEMVLQALATNQIITPRSTTRIETIND